MVSTEMAMDAGPSMVATQVADKTMPSITMLPPEIRRMIFAYMTVFCTFTPTTGRIFIHVCPDGSVRWGKSGPKDYAARINTNLMRVNREIGGEAQRLCYSGNHFFFGGPKHALAFLSPSFLGQMSFDSVRHVHFDITARVIADSEPKTKCLDDWKRLCEVIGTLKDPEVYIKIWNTYYYGDEETQTMIEWNEDHPWTQPVMAWKNLHSLHMAVNGRPIPETVVKRLTTSRESDVVVTTKS